jgi:aromatic-L-amino-acid decarboxylase
MATKDQTSSDAARKVALHLDPEAFRAAGHALVDSIAAFLPALRDRAVTPFESPQVVQSLIDADAPLPDEGSDAQALLESTAAMLFDHSLFNGHPRFFGYITSSPAPIGMLGDLLAAAVNANVGSWRLAPVATEIEAQTVRWIADLIGYPTSGGGLLVSGGNMANMVGFWAARAATAAWDVRAQGLNATEAQRLRIYASAETHTWLQKAADLSGLGTDAIRWIPTDESLRMDLGALRQTMAADRAAGDRAMMVVGTAGSVSTGVVDPLRELAEICRESGTWFHVDGAYGALAAAADDVPDDLRALSLADSVAVDPHKWLYAPLEAGCVLVRNTDTLRNAFAYHPPYYHFGQEATNFVDFGPQNSRGFRALKVWLALRQAGRNGYRQMIGDDIALSRHLHDAVQAHPELDVATQALSITTFRYVPSSHRAGVGTDAGEAYLNALNAALLDRIQGSGELFVSNAVVRGRYLLRACVVNINTTRADVEAVPEIVVRIGREVQTELEKAVKGEG